LGENRNWTIKPKEEWVIKPCEAIVSEDLWDECNNILDEQEKGRKKPTKRAVHLFTTVLHCDCGSKMYVPSASKKYICLTCRKRRIDITDLEEIYYAKLKSFLVNEDTISSFIKKTDETIISKEHELATLQVEQKRLEIEMSNLVVLFQAGQIPRDGFGKYYNPLNEQSIQIQKHIPELQSQIDFLKVEYLNRDKVLQDAINLHERWPTLSIEDKRHIVEEITESIVVTKDSIRIKYSYDPSAHLLQIAADGQRNLAPVVSLIIQKKNALVLRVQCKNI
jgi:site-specific DNA recombinase